MTTIELNKDNCIELLKRYVNTGYSLTGSLSIKEGALLHQYFRILQGTEEAIENLSKSDILATLFRSLEVFNKNKAYSLDDVAVIDRVIKFFESNPLEESSEPKIKEI
jgi:activator of HSP90 ATPase